MEIIKTNKDNGLEIALKGRLDTTTAPSLEEVITNELDGVSNLVFNFEELDYVSSAGLRVLLAAQKKMNKQGSMKLIKVKEEVQSVFEITGFSDILNIE